MLLDYVNGQTSVVLRIKLRNSSVATGAGLTGLTSASAGLVISTIADNESSPTSYTVAGSTIETITTLGTYAAPTSTKCRFKEVSSGSHPGLYEIQLADARFAVSSAKSLMISVSGTTTNLAECDVVIPLRAVNPYDAVRGGLTALPNTAATTNASLLTSGTGTDQISVSAGKVLLQATQSGVTIPTVTTVTNQLTAAAVATGVWQDSTGSDFTTASSIGKSLYTSGVVPGASGGLFIAGTNAATTITTALTTTFTGNLTGSVGSVTGSVGSISGVSFPANFSSFSIDASGRVDLGKILGTASAGTAGYVGIDWANVTAPTTSVALTGTTISTSQAVGSVSGAVGSVTGAVGSVTGAVGSVTGAVGGDVTGKVLGGGASSFTAVGVQADLQTIKTQTVTASAGVTFPASLASPTNITAGTITTVTNLTNAPTSGDFTSTMKTSLNAATPASIVGAVGSVTGNVGGNVSGNVTGSVGSIATGGISSTSFAANSITAASLAADADTEIAAAVWDLLTSGHTTSGTFGAAVVAAGSVGDPWATSLPGSYGAGTAGSILGTNLDAAVTSRMATYAQPSGFLAATFPTSIASPTNITAGTITTATNVTTVNGLAADVITAASIAADAGAEIAAAVRDVSNGSPAAGSFGEAARNADAKAAVIIITLGTPAVTVSDDIAAVPGAVWDLATSGHTTSGTFGAAAVAAGGAGDPWATMLPSSYGTGTAGFIVGTNLNATIGSRSTYSGGAVSGVTGDVGGKVLGGGIATILATGVWALDGFGNASVPQTGDVGNLIPARLVMTAGKVWALDGDGNAIAPAATALSNATWTGAKAAFLDAAISSRLAPTVAGHTLDVSVTGEAGIDWSNIGSPTTAVNLSGTTISTSQAVASVTGAVGSVTGSVGGNVTGSVGSLAGSVTLNLSQTGLVPRDLGSIADANLTIGDGFVAAICAAAGKQNIVSTSYSVHTPHDNTLIRTFVLDSASVPTSRT